LLDWLVHIKTIQDLQTEAKVIVGVLALTTGVGELITATSWVVRGVAALETTIAASDLILMNTSVRNAVKGCFATPQEGEDFLKSYENITLILNGAAATHGLVRLFRTDIHQFHAKYTARKTTIDASPTVSADAKAALQKLDDAVVAGKVGDVVEGVMSVFKVGDEIAGFVVNRVKNGTNGKVAIVGRKMGPIETVGNSLVNEGKQVELFNFNYQQNSKFNIEGIEYNWSQIDNEFNSLKNQYGTIPDNILENSLMFKANRAWAEKVKSQGYTIIDLGNPTNEATQSIFYNMEISTIF